MFMPTCRYFNTKIKVSEGTVDVKNEGILTPKCRSFN
jgi:hypothetical protein